VSVAAVSGALQIEGHDFQFRVIKPPLPHLSCHVTAGYTRACCNWSGVQSRVDCYKELQDHASWADFEQMLSIMYTPLENKEMT
jgi:hypothetical protein